MLQFIAPLLASSKVKKGLGIFAVIAVLGGSAFLYVQYTSKRIADMETERVALIVNEEKARNALKSSQDALERSQRNFEAAQEQNRILQEANEKAREYQESLIEVLTKHDLEYLALKKPGLIETRVNNATQKVFDSLESITATPE